MKNFRRSLTIMVFWFADNVWLFDIVYVITYINKKIPCQPEVRLFSYRLGLAIRSELVDRPPVTPDFA